MLVIFETVRPFRGVEVRGVPELVEGDVSLARAAIVGYLGVEDGERFAAERRSRPGVLLQLAPDSPRVWDLSGAPANLIDPEQHRTTPPRVWPAGWASCELLALASDSLSDAP